MTDETINKVAARIDVDTTPAQQKLAELDQATQKLFQTTAKRAATSAGDTFLQGADGAIRNLKQQMKELELQYKEGLMTAQQYFDKLQGLRTQYANALDVRTNAGMFNDQALRDALNKAQAEVSKFQDFELQSQRRLAEQNAAIQAENEKQTQLQLKREEQARANSIDAQMKQIRTLYDVKVVTAQESLAKIEALMTQETDYFQANVDKQMQAMKMQYSYQSAMASESASARSRFTSAGSARQFMTGSSGFTAGKMIAGMVGFDAMMGIYQSMVDGMKQVEAGAAGIQQVFEKQITTQDQLNQVTNETISIAQKYGTQISDVMDGMKLYGRQYKDVETAMTLVNSATLLSVVDNVNLTDANRALEATMNSLGLAAHTQADAYANSMRIVDSWSQLAHQASVSATQLMQAVEASGGAAHAVGVNFDQLNALATSAVRNTGMSGANIGNMLKSLFASIQTDKAAAALKTLDISIKQVGANGQEQFRPVFDVLLQLSQKLQTTNDSQQKLLETISGGKFQWSKVSSMLSDYNTIIDAYATSINSAGAATQYAQVQMDTLGRDIQRLKDAFVGLAAQTDQGGLGAFLKDIVNGLTNLLTGLEQMPKWLGDAGFGVVAFLVGLRSLVGVMNTLDPLSKVILAGMQKWAPTMYAAVAGTEAETAATVGLTGAFSALDIMSGGLALALGAVVAIVASSAIANGQAATAAQDHTQALQDQIGAMQQEYNLAQQKQQFMQTAISQEQQLKQALNDHTLSAKQHNQVLNDMVSLYHAVGKATGDESLQQVSSSNVQNQSLNKEQQAIAKLVQAKKTAYEDAVKINSQQVQDDINTTNQEITDINSKIDALGKETQAQFIAQMSPGQKFTYYFEKITGPIRAAMAGFDHNATDQKADINAPKLAGQYLKQQRQNMMTNYQDQFNSLQTKMAQDQYKIASNNLDLFNVDTSGVGDIVPPKGVGSGGGKTKTGSALSQYLQPFQDYTQGIQDSLTPFQDKISLAEVSVRTYADAMKLAEQQLKDNANDHKAAAAYVSAYHQQQSALNQSISAYTAENAQISTLIPQVQKQIANVNAEHAKGKTTAKEHRDALAALDSELTRLKTTFKTNEDAIINTKYNLAALTEQWKQHNSAIMNTQFAAKLKQDQGTIDGYTKSLTTATRAVSDYSREMSRGQTDLKNNPLSGSANSMVLAGYSGQVSELNRANALLTDQNKAVQKTIADLNSQLHEYTTALHQGRITADDFNTKQQDINNQLQQKTQLLYQNQDAMNANKDTMAQLREQLLQTNATTLNDQFAQVQRHDSLAVQEFARQLTTATHLVNVYSRELKYAEQDIKQNGTAPIYAAYAKESTAIQQSNADLVNQNGAIQKSINDLNSELVQAAQKYASGKITLQDYQNTTDQLHSKIDSLTQSLFQNQEAIQSNTDTLNQSAQDMADKINQWNFDNAKTAINGLVESMKDLETTQINDLDAKIKAIDQQLTNLQNQNQADSNQDKLTKLQQEAALWKDSTSVQGRQKYQDYLQQIKELTDQMNYDHQRQTLESQKQGYTDQKSTLQQHLQDLTSIYSGLSDNVTSITDTMNQVIQAQAKETNSVILGYLNTSLPILEKVKDTFITVQQNASAPPIVQQVPPAQPSDPTPVPGKTQPVPAGPSAPSPTIWTFADQNGHIVYTGTDYSAGKAQAGGVWLNGKWVGNGSYGSDPGVAYSPDEAMAHGGNHGLHFAGGGVVPNIGTPGMDSVPAMLTPGEVVVPQVDFANIASALRSGQSVIVHNDFANAFNGAMFNNRDDLDYAIEKISIDFERRTTARMRALGLQPV